MKRRARSLADVREASCSSRSAFASRRSAGKVSPCSRSSQRECASSPGGRRSSHQTVAAFKASLPLDDRIIHCRWSGESNWIPWGDRDFGIGPENATSYPHPGELALYPGGQHETELLFPYGYCKFASKAGQLWANHFATIVEGQEQLPQLGRLTLWEGAQQISFRTLSP